MAAHTFVLAWEIPWTEEPGGLQSVGSQRIGHDRAHTPSFSSWRGVNTRSQEECRAVDLLSCGENDS